MQLAFALVPKYTYNKNIEDLTAIDSLEYNCY